LAKNVPFFYLKINPIFPFCLSDFLGYNCVQRPAAWRSGGLLAPKLLKIPELWLSTFASKKAPNPPFCQTAC